MTSEQWAAYKEFYREQYDHELVNRQLTLGHIQSLIDEYELNQAIKFAALTAAKAEAMILVQHRQDKQLVNQCAATIRVCKEVAELITLENIELRKEIRWIRSNPYGKKNRKR